MSAVDAPSKIYQTIWKAMHARQQIAFLYNDRRRKACPIILGYSRDHEEAVFAFQFAGATTGASPVPQWRCFYLAKIRDLHSCDGE